MKRMIATILAAMTLLALLASCASTNETPTTQETTAASTTTPVTMTTGTPATTTEPSSTPTPVTPTPVTSTPVTPTPVTPTPVTPTPTVTPIPQPADPYEVLKGKTAIYVGDSIVNASTDEKKPFSGWAGRLKEEYDMKSYDKTGGDGQTVSTVSEYGTIVNQLKSHVKKYDFVMLEGGVNDAWFMAEIGRIYPASAEETDVETLDKTTLAGALEYELWYAKKYFPASTIGYIITGKSTHTAGSVSDMSRHVEVIRLACEKWGVPYLDLYNNETFNKEFQPSKKINSNDGLHPTSAGYEIYTRYIAQFMADIYGVEVEPHFELKAGTVDVKATLSGKTVAFFGDSIGDITSHDERQLSYAGRIAELYDIVSTNRCKSGASISTIRGTNTVYSQAKALRRGTFDMIVLEGGVNDAWDNAPIGALCDEVTIDNYNESKLDLTTLAGGLEQLFYEIKHNHADSTVVYIINYRLNSTAGSLRNMTKYVNMIKDACDKWEIPYLDLYSDGYVTAKFSVRTSTVYVPDGIHPSGAGYDFLAPLFAEFMADEYYKMHA